MGRYLKISIPCNVDVTDLLIAELSLMKFDSFQENVIGFDAFIIEELFDNKLLSAILDKYGITTTFKIEKLEDVNWNEKWEKNFEPVIIGEKLQIRATFHKLRKNIRYDIIINPKMSFGTGHHETTNLIVSEQLKINHIDKSILDVGTGTGILAIIAYKLGAKSIVATDTDKWCIENSKENIEMNQVKNIEILQGTIDNLTLPEQFDVIYANINKNVLMEELPFYAKLLAENGIIVLSGFYSDDVDDLMKKVVDCNLTLAHTEELNNWAIMRLIPSQV